MISFTKTDMPEPGIAALSEIISSYLKRGKPVLWLIPGGSNIPISVEIMDRVRKGVGLEDLRSLTVTLTDERYGPVGHKDSNWKQLEEAGMTFNGLKFIAVLDGSSLEVTAKRWGKDFRSAAKENEDSGGLIVGQFGMGADGHIAGILPNSPAAADLGDHLVSAYEAGPFIRITLTFEALKMLDSAYLFAFGETKKQALIDLQTGNKTLNELPALVLQELPEAHVYSERL